MEIDGVWKIMDVMGVLDAMEALFSSFPNEIPKGMDVVDVMKNDGT